MRAANGPGFNRLGVKGSLSAINSLSARSMIVFEACTILTTTPNPLLADIHDRMPVILHLENHDLSLDPAIRDTISVSEMLRPFDPVLMRSYPVSTRVNHVVNDDAECAKPLELEPSPAQSQLF